MLKSSAAQLRNDLLINSPQVLIYKLTAIFLVMGNFRGDGTGLVNVIATSLGILMLLSSDFLKNKKAWVFLLAVLSFSFINRWEHLDNNKFTTFYWILICTLSLFSVRAEETLSQNAKVLVGLTFSTAVLWKCFAGQYFDGTFMTHTLLVDSRVALIERFLGGVMPDVIEHNHRLDRALNYFPGPNVTVSLELGDKVRALGKVVSYWTLFIEGSIGVSFLLSRFFKIKNFHNLCLVTFVSTTYLLAPVPGFGMMLSMAGFAQCQPTQVKWKATFLSMFFLMVFTRLMPYISRYLVYQM